MARALLVGCGCHGREVGRTLLDAGWAVRGTSRGEAGLEAIAAAGIEPAQANPDRVGTILDHVGDVTVVAWLLGSASGTAGEVDAVNRLRLGSLLEKLVDTPVRGFVFEAVGNADPDVLEAGAELVERAARTWMIPARIVRAERDREGAWSAAMVDAVTGVLG